MVDSPLRLALRCLLPLVLVPGLLSGCPAAVMNRAVASSRSAQVDAAAGGEADATEGEESVVVEAAAAEAEAEPALPLAPATLPAQLDAARVRSIAAIDRVVFDWESGGLPVRALAFGDDTGAHVCVAYEGPPRCWTLAFVPRYVGEVSAWQSEGRLRVQTSFGLEGGGHASVTVHGLDLRATLERTGAAPQPVEDVRPRDVPALFGQVEGLDLVMSGTTLIARSGDQVRVCRRADVGFACTEPVPLDALAGEQRSLQAVHEDFRGLVGIEYSWEEQDGDVYTAGQGILYLRASATEARQLAHVVVAYARRSRVELERDDIEHVEFEMYEVDPRRETCLLVGAPTVRRRVERENGSTSALRAPRLQRAPDLIPAEGVAPLRYDLRGAWAFDPEGGLRRIARCDYEDE